ncbi:MAG: O-antigen ligase family protein [Syntrophales bacterium]
MKFFMIKNKEKVSEYLTLITTFFLLAFVFIIPFPRATAIEEISFYSAVILAVISIKISDFSLKTPLTTPLAIFFLWALLTLPFAINKQNSIHDVYAHLLKYLVLFLLLYNYFNTIKKFKVLIWTLILSGGIFSFSALIYCYLILKTPLAGRFELHNYIEIPINIIGVIAVFMILLSLHQMMLETGKYRKLLIYFSISSLTLTTLATQTKSAILALVIGSLISFPHNKKIITLYLLAIVLLMAVLPIKNRISSEVILRQIQGDERVKIWYAFHEMAKDHLYAGIGYGMQTYFDEKLLKKYNDCSPPKYRQVIPHKAPHNLFVDLAVRTGFIGLIVFLNVIIVFIITAWKLIKSGKNTFIQGWALVVFSALISFLIQSMFENTLSGPPAHIMYTIFAIMMILWKLNEEIKPTSDLIEK